MGLGPAAGPLLPPGCKISSKASYREKIKKKNKNNFRAGFRENKMRRGKGMAHSAGLLKLYSSREPTSLFFKQSEKSKLLDASRDRGMEPCISETLRKRTKPELIQQKPHPEIPLLEDNFLRLLRIAISPPSWEALLIHARSQQNNLGLPSVSEGSVWALVRLQGLMKPARDHLSVVGNRACAASLPAAAARVAGV